MDTQKHLYDLIKGFKTCMLVTHGRGGRHARPMAIAELKPRIDFQNAETDGKAELERIGGSLTPALWDGKALTVGESAVARTLLTIQPDPGPEREDGW